MGFLIIGKETNAAVLIRTKTKQLRKETGRDDLTSAYDSNKDAAELTNHAVLITEIKQAWEFWFSLPMVRFLALCLSLLSILLLVFAVVYQA